MHNDLSIDIWVSWSLSDSHGIKSRELTDVNDVSLLVYHDVAVVSVFDLKQETDDGVGCH
jgi:hypothetical protein